MKRGIQPVLINPVLRQLHRRSNEPVLFPQFRFLSSRQAAPSANKSLALKDNKQAMISPWVQKPDPQGSSLQYYWNTQTNQTTALGSPKPNHWVEVQDPAGSALTYWWNVENNQTTALGAPKPDLYDATGLAVYQPQGRAPFGYTYAAPQTLGQSMKMYFGLGLGMSIAFAAVRAILG